jgi:aspartyl protease family protein
MNRFILLAVAVLLLTALIAPSLKEIPAAGQAPAAGGAKAAATSPWSVQAPARPAAPLAGFANAEVIEIARDAGGQFHLELDAGGETIRFLVDTGADVVALTADDAERLGLRPDASAYQPILQTASGPGMGAPVRIERLTIGGRELEDVEAVVVPDLPVSLLGQSALRRLGSVTLQGDRLTIAG